MEDEPICEDKLEEMCDQDGDNCVNYRRKVCTTTQVSRMKVIPSTSCDQKEKNICTTPACPVVCKNDF